jgi:MFS family permease
VPLDGKLADMYGRKPVLLFGIAVFLFGSAASGAAGSMSQLIAFRALQGLGAGALQPIALTVVGDIFDLEERARIQGVFGAAWGFFGMTGPAIGGFLVERLSWRWVFYVNLPFGVASAVIVLLVLRERVERRRHRVDAGGAALLMAGLTALLLATSRSAQGVAAWAGPLALVLLVAFVLVERRAAEPVLPLWLFSRRVLVTASLSGAVIGGAMMVVTTFIPLFVKAVLRLDTTHAGMAVTPMLVGWPIASTVSGRLIPRLGFRLPVRLGLALTLIAALILALYGERGGLRQLQLISALFGVGMGFANTALLIAVQTSVAWGERGVATASTMFFRTIGGAVAVSATGGVLNAALSGAGAPADLASKVLSAEGASGVDPAVLDRVGGAFALGIGWIFWIVVAIAATAFVTCLFFPEVAVKRPVSATAPGEPGEPAIGH